MIELKYKRSVQDQNGTLYVNVPEHIALNTGIKEAREKKEDVTVEYYVSPKHGPFVAIYNEGWQKQWRKENKVKEPK